MVALVAVTNLPQDPNTEAVETIGYEHHEIHAGNAFRVCDLLAVDDTIAKWLITTPDTLRHSHMVVAIEGTGEVELLVTEGADRSGTTPITAYNRNRNSVTAATATVHRGATGGATDGAITLIAIRAGATGQASKTIAPGAGRSLNEFILKQNTKYVVSVETFAAIYVSVLFDWYEHTAKA